MSIDNAISTLDSLVPTEAKAFEWPPIAVPKLPVPPPFPLDALPEVLRNMAQEVSKSVKTPVALAASAILASVGFAIGGRTYYYVKKSLKGRANLYMLIFAARGERKSSVYDILDAPFRKWTKEKIKEYNEKMLELEVKKRRFDKLQDILSNPKSNPETIVKAQMEAMEIYIALQDIPPSPDLFTNDATQEAMVQKMSRCGGLLGVFSDDGRTIMKIIIGRKYSKDGSASDELFLDSFDGTKTVNYDRSGRSIEPIERPCIGMLLMVQLDLLRAMGEQSSIFDSGFVSRCLFCLPESWVGKRYPDGKLMRDIDDFDVSDDTADAYEKLIIKFLNQSYGIKEERYIGLSTSAKEFWNDHYRAIEGESGEDGSYYPILDFAARFSSQILRLALIIALTNDHEKIELADIQEAHTIMRYYMTNAERCYMYMRSLTMPDDSVKVLDYFKKHRECNDHQSRDIYRSLSMDTKRFDVALELLVERNYCRRIFNDAEKAIGGRPASYRIEVNPGFLQGAIF